MTSLRVPLQRHGSGGRAQWQDPIRTARARCHHVHWPLSPRPRLNRRVALARRHRVRWSSPVHPRLSRRLARRHRVLPSPPALPRLGPQLRPWFPLLALTPTLTLRLVGGSSQPLTLSDVSVWPSAAGPHRQPAGNLAAASRCCPGHWIVTRRSAAVQPAGYAGAAAAATDGQSDQLDLNKSMQWKRWREQACARAGVRYRRLFCIVCVRARAPGASVRVRVWYISIYTVHLYKYYLCKWQWHYVCAYHDHTANTSSVRWQRCCRAGPSWPGFCSGRVSQQRPVVGSHMKVVKGTAQKIILKFWLLPWMLMIISIYRFYIDCVQRYGFLIKSLSGLNRI